MAAHTVDFIDGRYSSRADSDVDKVADTVHADADANADANLPHEGLHTQYTLLVAGIFYDADAGVDASHAGADADVVAGAFSSHDIYIITWQSLDLPGSHLREIDL